MGDKFYDWLESFATGKAMRLFWIGIISILIIISLFIPYFDASFFAHNRISTRIENLQDLLLISDTPLASQPVLQKEYDHILKEIDQANCNTLIGVTGKLYPAIEKRLKFWGGSIFFFCFSILILLDQKQNRDKTLKGYITNNLASFLLLVSIGYAAGYISMLLPTFGFPAVNALLAPVIEILIILFMLRNEHRTKTKEPTK